MCDYCENEKQLLTETFPDTIFGQIIDDQEVQVIVDRGYLRLGEVDDMNCLDHGGKIKINFCPMCGIKFN